MSVQGCQFLLTIYRAMGNAHVVPSLHSVRSFFCIFVSKLDCCIFLRVRTGISKKIGLDKLLTYSSSSGSGGDSSSTEGGVVTTKWERRREKVGGRGGGGVKGERSMK
jgi:hypothetical protein